MNGPVASDPVPDERAAKRRVTLSFEQVARRYDAADGFCSAPVATRLIQAARIGPGDRVLDVGCGTGSALLRAAAAALPGGHVTGVDLSQAMLDVALAKARDAGLANVVVLVGDAEEPPDPPCRGGAFDKVIASLLLFLLPHPEQAVRHWLRLLRPGGMIAFSWNVSEDPAWAPALAAADRYVQPGFPRFAQIVRHWPLTSVGELEHMLAQCGCADVTTVTADLAMRYAGPAAWWESSWALAPRISWQHIPEEQLPAARAEVLGVLDALRDPADGSLTRTVRFGWTTARR